MESWWIERAPCPTNLPHDWVNWGHDWSWTSNLSYVTWSLPCVEWVLPSCLVFMKHYEMKSPRKKKKKAQERGIFQADLELFLLEKRSKKQPEALQVSMTKALLWCPRRPWPQKMLHKVEKSDSTSIWWLINPPANNNHVPFLSPAFLFLLRLLLRSSYLFLSEITSINLISK